MVTSDARVGRLITLPSRSPAWLGPDVADAPKANGPHEAPHTLQVLLVEDDPGDAGIVSFALRAERSPTFKIVHRMTLGDAIEALGSDTVFDVVLLDLSLPDSFGLETVTRVLEAAPRLPIVIMTGNDDPQFAAKALESGAQDYLVKTDDPSGTVSRAIRYAITRKTAELERQDMAERIAAHQRILMQEVAAARGMQFDLLPRAERLTEALMRLDLEIEAYFEPSSGIGGDLWGCMVSGENRFCCYAFDFSGHGIGAALNVFRLHALIAEHWSPNLDPANLLEVLGRSLNGLLRRGQFATMFFGIIDFAANELTWSAAGVPPPVMVSQGKASFLDSRGVPLGLLANPKYVNHKIAFKSGDSLVLYSDAITDAEVEGQSFGQDRFARLVDDQLLQHGELRVDGILDAFHALSPPPNDDDLTAVRFSRLAR